ncbi:ATP-binding protein [Streptomyces sp. F63]|uniref:ATP-binding protein n=1 Tax=Streptomyces sp. F63 TaxID=2824887 RepID=UPI001B36F820|nr:ATP-binding protein [Streptomyces sp. F63]
MTSKPRSPGGTHQHPRPVQHPHAATVVGTAPAPHDHTFRMQFTSTPRGARLARRLAAHRLDEWGIPYGTPEHEAIVLIVAELTSNAVRHGHVPGRDFRLRLHVTPRPRTVRVEVTDARTERVPPRPAAVRAPGGEDTGGRGLLLVAGLASRWDWHPRPDGPGKTVWAECAMEAP